ncbi:MAG: hypothetical protein KatS3mg101_0654 [Patescibacteria group bacterium]|nr:MAG: hypothetical protein KatS3mg101_0654 [Patescibacteria group bacterium]
MEPVGLMYKSHNELCIVHRCLSCGKLNHNRIASDDKPDMIEALLNKPKLLEPETQLILDNSGVKLLDSRDKMSVHIQLYGKP